MQIQLTGTGGGDTLLFESGIARDTVDGCCCWEPCCGRFLPGQNGGVDELPSTLNFKLSSVDCPCLTDYTNVATWDSVDSRWEKEGITWPGCNYPNGYIYISCGGSYGDPSIIWSVLLGNFGPCVGGDGTSIRFYLTCSSCNPIDCGPVNAVITGLHCCATVITFPPQREGGTIGLEVWE